MQLRPRFISIVKVALMEENAAHEAIAPNDSVCDGLALLYTFLQLWSLPANLGVFIYGSRAARSIPTYRRCQVIFANNADVKNDILWLRSKEKCLTERPDTSDPFRGWESLQHACRPCRSFKISVSSN